MDAQLLLVEDDENLGYILKEYLEMNEFAVDWAKDGEEGYSEVKSNDYDLCILDIMMPKKDGFTLAKEIKELNKEIPFIFLTAKTLKVDKLKGFDLGADDYIVKPVDEELLIARIKAILNRFEYDETITKDKYQKACERRRRANINAPRGRSALLVMPKKGRAAVAETGVARNLGGTKLL